MLVGNDVFECVVCGVFCICRVLCGTSTHLLTQTRLEDFCWRLVCVYSCIHPDKTLFDAIGSLIYGKFNSCIYAIFPIRMKVNAYTVLTVQHTCWFICTFQKCINKIVRCFKKVKTHKFWPCVILLSYCTFCLWWETRIFLPFHLFQGTCRLKLAHVLKSIVLSIVVVCSKHISSSAMHS